MNILYDVCFICFEELKSDARTLNLVRTYVKYGKKVAVIAPVSPQDKDMFQHEGVDIYPIAPPKKSRFWLRWLRFHNAARKFKKIKAKVFWANDFYSLYTAQKFALSNKSKLFYDSREIYSALGPLAQNQFKQGIITELERKLIDKVDRIIVSGKMDEEYLRNHFDTSHPYTVIMNLPPYYDGIQSNLIRDELGLPDSMKILLYQGVLLKGRGIIPVIRALPCIEDAVLVIIGWGPHQKDFEEVARALNVSDRVFFMGKKPYDELFGYTASADVGLSYIEPITLSYRLALPNKLFEYCMARIPSLVSDLPAMRQILSEYQIGELIQVGADPAEFVKVIRSILDNKQKYAANCEIASHKYCYSAQEPIILSLLK